MKILIITDFYYPKPLANGICAGKIAKSLSKYYDVSVLCYRGLHEKDNYEIDGIKVYKVRSRLFYYLREYGEINNNTFSGRIIYKLSMLLQKLKKILFILWYPLTSPIFVLRIYRKAKKICKTNEINAVFCTFNPLEAPIVGMLLKKNKIVKYNIGYFLDTLTNTYNEKNLIKKIFSQFGWRWEKKLFKSSDLIFNMESYRELLNDNKYDKYREKMALVDIPYIEDFSQNIPKFCNKKDGGFHFLYAGALIKNMRNPEKTCIIMNEYLKQHKNAILSFYSRGNCEDIVLKYSKLSNGKIKQKGYIEKAKLDEIVNNCDIIISIGNKNSKMISSKMFEYISMNKKIIHFYSDINDPNIFYLKKYPNGLILNENDPIKDNINKIEEFSNSTAVNVSYEKLKKYFLRNTPEYTVEFIKKLFQNEK